MNNNNKHKPSASQGDNHIHMTLQSQPKSQQINIAHQFHSGTGLKSLQMGSQNQTNISNIFQNQKSQRINHSSIMAGPNSTAAHQMNITRANNADKLNQSSGAITSVMANQEQYKHIKQNFNSRQPLGTTNTTPINALTASFTQGHGGQQTSVQATAFNGSIQHPKIISSQMRSSVGQVNNLKQYTNKENMGDIQMRSTSGGPTSTSHQQKMNSGSQLASRHHQMSKGQNSSSGGNLVHGRNFFPQQQSNQNIKQAFQVNTQAVGGSSASGINPSLNYQQPGHNYNINSTKYSQSNIGPQILNRTSPQSFLQTAMSHGFPQNQKGNPQQYSSNKNVGGKGAPMTEITAVANGAQNSLANTSNQMQTMSNQSKKQGGGLQQPQLGGRLSHPATSGSGLVSNNPSKANLIEMNLKLSQKSMKQGMPANESSQCSGVQSGSGSNRIPQPSIINSATGNMNQIIRQQSPKSQDPFKQAIPDAQNYHSQQQQFNGNGTKDGILKASNRHSVANDGSRVSGHQNIQAPMIIEKKFNLHGVTSNPQLIQQNQNIQIQNNSRYGSRDSTAGTSGNNMNISMMHSSKLSGNMKSFEQMNSNNPQRNSSHSNNTSIGQNNMVKQRMRSNGTVGTGNNTQQRYNVAKSGNQTSTGMRNIEISSRLQEPFKNVVQGGGQSNNSSFVMPNKYGNLHQKAHENNRASGGLVNSNINKSGQNLNNNLQRSSVASKALAGHNGNVAQTQRSGRMTGGISNTIGGTSGRSSLKQSHNNAGHITNQSSHQKNQVNNFGKQQNSGVVQKILKEHEAKHDKENKQRLSNKQSSLSQGKSGSSLNQMSKRNNTSENLSRQSIMAMQGQSQKQQRNVMQQQNSSLGMMNNGQRSQHSSNKGATNHTMHSNGTAGHQKSKTSTENEHTSSQGNASTGQRRNSSQHNTNRSNTAVQQSAGASRTLQRLNEANSQQHPQMIKQGSQQVMHEQSQHSNEAHQNNQQLLRRKSARELNQNSKSMTQYAHDKQQLDTSMPADNFAIQNAATQRAEEGPFADNMMDKQMVIHPQAVPVTDCLLPNENVQMDGEEGELPEETTMNEGVVALEGETTQDGQQLPVVVQQPEVHTTAAQPMAQKTTGQTAGGPSTQAAAAPALTRPQFDTEKLKEIVAEMDLRRKDWLRQYKTNLDLNDVLEIRNPQSVIEFVPEILVNMKKEELNHMYPANFLDRSIQMEISDKYRQYLVDWLAELHYKFKMWPETLFVTVGIIDKTLTKWRNFRKADLQCLGITALHIAGKYEEIYPPELRTILQVIDNAVTRQQVCEMEFEILNHLDFDMVYPSILRFMQRYACISNFSNDQHFIAQMFCDFMLLNTGLLQHRPSLLGAVAIYATNKITNRKYPWNASLRKCTLGIQEEDVKQLANELFYFVKRLESSSLKTMFRKYELQSYQGVVNVLQKIQMPNTSTTAGGQTPQQPPQQQQPSQPSNAAPQPQDQQQ